MKSKHGFKFVSRIPLEDVELLHESWIEYARKKVPSEKDRAKNITYDLPRIGPVTLSHSSGTITVDNNDDEEGIKRLFKPELNRSSYELFCKELHCGEVGVHF